MEEEPEVVSYWAGKAEQAKANPGMAILAVTPGQDLKVQELLTEVMKAKEYADKRVIESDRDAKDATNDLSMMAQLKKAIEEKRKEYLGPVQQKVKEFNEAFKLLTDPLLDADRTTRSKVLSYHQEIDRKRKEAEAIAQEKAMLEAREAALEGREVQAISLPPEQSASPNHVRAEAGMAGKAVNWKFRVVDFSLVPEKYKVLDYVHVGKLVRAGEREIPGLEIYPEQSLRVTSTKA